MNYKTFLIAGLSAPALILGSMGTAAHAQSASGNVDELVVTGSRVAKRSKLETLAPVDVVGSAALTQQATPELGQALANLIPSMDFPRPAITDGTDSIRPATLRGLAPDQTLVLLNGKRYHSSALVNVNGSIGRGSAAVDLNTIPAVAIDRVEVLRDGASAQYGSDAIAGVINLRLRDASHGGGLSASWGEYNTDVVTARNPNGRTANDGNVYTLSGWQGLPLGADGFLTVSADYAFRNPTNRSDLDPRVTPFKVTARYGDPRVESKTFYANAGKPLAEGFEAYGWLGYQNRLGDSAANPRLATNANNVLSIFPNGFLPLITTDIDDMSAGGGVKGTLSGFTVDASLSYGKNKVKYGVINSVNASMGAASPTTFDAGAMEYDMLTANLDLSHPVSLGLATPSQLAFGAEYRSETYQIKAGTAPSYIFGGAAGKGAGAQGFPGFKPANEVDKSRNAFSLYADLDNQVTKAFDVDIAVRYEDYSDFGSTGTGKIAARYDFNDAFALRGAVSTGFRAPSLQQQYFTATSTNFISIGGVSTPVEVGTFPATSLTARALGGKALQPEKSNNYAAGLVYHVGGFELTADAYYIELNNRIVLSENITGSAPGTAGASATALAIYSLINPVGSGGALGAARFFINGVDTTTKGLDVVARYRYDINDLGKIDFTLAGNFNQTKVNRLPTTSQLSALPVPPALFARSNRLTFEKGTPKEKFVFTTEWTNDKMSATLKASRYGDVLVPNNTATLDFHTGAHTLVDLEARYKLMDKINLAVGANNMFDEYPNMTPTNVNTNGPVGFPGFSPFGFNGRFVYTRVSYSW
jgi:iron complex outermembrane recepter protein